MFDDESDPKLKKKTCKGLDPMSLSELQNYISDMKQEILRVETEMKKKADHQDSVSSFFKS